MVRAVEQIDLDQFPPPDLAVEVDITSSSLDRFSIYADLGIPEVWRYDGQSLTIYHLQEGQYEICDRSVALPLLKAADRKHFGEAVSPMDQNVLIRWDRAISLL